METRPPVASSPPASAPRAYSWYHWRRLGRNFLIVAVLVHVFFGFGAAYFIVQTISARQKSTFAAGPSSANAAKHATEHKVQLQKKQQTMSAPAAIQRITTTATNAKVVLPQIPAMPAALATLTPAAMAGMGGNGVGLQMGGGGGQGNGNSAGGGLNLFGIQGGKGLKGTFYDLKQTPGKTPTEVKKLDRFVHELNAFLLGGWQPRSLDKYFKSPTALSANQIFVPRIASAAAPKAFGVEKDVEPRYWMALYRGQVSPPESGTYHFVGGGDNILIVRFGGRIVGSVMELPEQVRNRRKLESGRRLRLQVRERSRRVCEGAAARTESGRILRHGGLAR